jgi:PAS domain S-box-containing protein
MKDGNRTKERLMGEVTALQGRVAELERQESERSPSETAPHEAHLYAEAIIDTVREPLVVLDQNLKVLSASRSFYDTFKVTLGETVGKHIYDLGNGQWNIPRLRKLLRDIFKNTKLDNYEVDHVFPVIGPKSMLLNARRIYKEDRGTRMVLLAIEDITGLRKADEALQASETRYRRLFETAQDGILILDADTGQINDVNPFLIAMLGYSYEEFVGKRLWEIGAFKDVGANKVAFEELQQKGYIRYEGLPLRTKDGREIAVEFVSNVYMVNHHKVIQCNIRDITIRRVAEKELQRSQKLFYTIARLSPVGLFRTDGEGQYVYVNEYWSEITGLSPDKTYGEGWAKGLHPADRERVLNEWHLAVQRDLPFESEFRFRMQSGVIKWVIGKAIAERGVDGERLGYVGTITDITGRRLMEEELQKAHDELEKRVVERTAQLLESNESLKREIANGIIIGEELKESRERLRNLSKHLQEIREQERAFLSRELHDELGQALTGIKMDIRWIERRLPEDSTSIVERLHSIITLIDDAILAVQRISTELRPPALDDFGLSEAIKTMVMDFEKRAKLTCRLISTPKRIVINREMSTEVFRIVQAALTNVARHAGAKNVRILLQKTGDKLIVEVRDDGRGITKKEINDLNSIGLTGMRERACAMEGNLEISGIRGKGTTVALHLSLDEGKDKNAKTAKRSLKTAPEEA